MLHFTNEYHWRMSGLFYFYDRQKFLKVYNSHKVDLAIYVTSTNDKHIAKRKSENYVGNINAMYHIVNGINGQ